MTVWEKYKEQMAVPRAINDLKKIGMFLFTVIFWQAIWQVRVMEAVEETAENTRPKGEQWGDG